MRLRIGIGMARMSTLCHKRSSHASYMIYVNALMGMPGPRENNMSRASVVQFSCVGLRIPQTLRPEGDPKQTRWTCKVWADTPSWAWSLPDMIPVRPAHENWTTDA